MNSLCKILFFVLLSEAYAKFPTDLPKCNSGDNECLPPTITKVLQTLQEGRKDLNLYPLEPLRINSIDIEQDADRPVSVSLHFKDIDLYGLTMGTVTKTVGFEKDPKTSKFEVTGLVPRLSIIGDYKVNGKVLVLPIQGEGKCNLTIDDVEIRGKFTPDVIIKNGKEYLQAKNLKLTFDTSRLYIQLDNLFNGDKALGDNMNMFMNENWLDILNELRPAFSDAIGQILENIINNVFSKFAYNEAWLDTAE